MFLVGILSWWYSEGWHQRMSMMQARLARVADFFSISLMLKTFFSPFRQISAGKTGGSLSNQMKAFGDQIISRVVGAFARLFLIIAGLIIITIQLVFIFVIMLFWPIIPLLPVVGLVLMIFGWVPAWQI